MFERQFRFLDFIPKLSINIINIKHIRNTQSIASDVICSKYNPWNRL